ncbi:MAG: DotA/TraY family protein, partial [Coxiellaceae bacterium]|nr:DotA/TraY family protein [Coxiellaceae bacterium]
MKIRTMGLLLLLPNVAWASTAVDNIQQNKEIFSVAVGDPTQGFLAQLFGSVGTVLHGTSGQLLGQVFHVFNLGVLVIASIFFLFTIITTVVNSAHEGRFMGSRQAKPAFSIIRTVAGFGLLLPLPSGYSLIQVLTMTVVLQGVGFANTAWNRALDYFADGGVVLVPPATDIANNINLAGTVLQAQVCMFHQQKFYQDRQAKEGGRYVGGFQPSFTDYSVRFPARPGNNANDAGCGEFSWGKSEENKNRHMLAAMQKLIEDTGVSARHIVDPQLHSEHYLQGSAEDAVVGGAADWLNFTLPARGKTNDKLNIYLTQARERGWIFAGTYYYGLTKIQRDLEDESQYRFKISQPILGINACGSGACDVINFPDDYTLFSKALSPKATQGENPTLEKDYMHAAKFVSLARKRAILADKKSEGGEESSISATVDDSRLASLLKPVFGKINEAQRALRNSNQTNTDPILQLQIAGNSLMSVLTAAWIIGSLTIFGISALASTFSNYSSLGFAIRDMLNFFTPIFMMLCTLLFIQGAIMAIYIPMVPFIIFTFSVMGWFVIVVESMAAAPLVALGLAHHEGHDMLGRSEEAIWLLLN